MTQSPQPDFALMLHADRMADIQDTLRRGTAVDFAVGDVAASA